MSDILDRAREAQRGHAHVTYLQIRLDFLQDLIAEIERLQAEAYRNRPATHPIGSISDINARHQLKADPT